MIMASSDRHTTVNGQKDENKKELSLIKSKCNILSTSSMASLLQEYGLKEDKKANHEKEKKSKKKKQRTKVFDVDDDREEERRKLKDEKCLQVLDDMQTLKHHYYNKYMDILNERIVKQRLDIKKRSDELEMKLAKEANKPKAPKLPKHMMVNNVKFLQNLPKTYFQKMIKLEENMYKDGKIKNTVDFDGFWKKHSRLKYDDQNPEETDPGEKPIGETELFPLVEESSRPNTREEIQNNWAITQQASRQYRKPAASSFRPARRTSVAKTNTQATELLFPRIEMPKLHCFTMDLAKPPPDPTEEAEKSELQMREVHRKLFLQKLKKMYHLAMTNTASTKRIIEKHGVDDLYLLLHGPELGDIIDNVFEIRDYPHDEKCKDDQQMWLEKLHSIRPIPEERESELGSSHVSVRSSTHSKSSSQVEKNEDGNKIKIPVQQIRSDLHLTYRQMVEGAKIMEAKCPSSFWINYAKNIPLET